MLSLTVSKDLILRTYTEDDATELYALVQANRAHLRQWLVWIDATQKLEHVLNYIRAARQGQFDQQSIAFGIFKKGHLVGSIDMHHWDQRLRKAQMGYWLSKSEEGNGLIYNSANVLIKYLFQNLNLNKIELHYQPTNTKSAAVAKRLGFSIEGLLRDHMLLNGSFQHLVIAGLLRSEWLTKAE